MASIVGHISAHMYANSFIQCSDETIVPEVVKFFGRLLDSKHIIHSSGFLAINLIFMKFID